MPNSRSSSLPRSAAGLEETGELALGKQHDLEELVGRHAHEIGDLGIGLTDPAGKHPPGPVGVFFEQYLGRLGGGACCRAVSAGSVPGCG